MKYRKKSELTKFIMSMGITPSSCSRVTCTTGLNWMYQPRSTTKSDTDRADLQTLQTGQIYNYIHNTSAGGNACEDNNDSNREGNSF